MDEQGLEQKKQDLNKIKSIWRIWNRFMYLFICLFVYLVSALEILFSISIVENSVCLGCVCVHRYIYDLILILKTPHLESNKDNLPEEGCISCHQRFWGIF